jgi:hypothetical protein
LRFIISAEKIRIINQTKTSPLVKYYATIISGILAALLISGFVSQAYAADLHAGLVPQQDKATVSYIGVKTVTLSYPAGSSLAQEFDGKSERVQFTLNGSAGEDGNGMGAVINSINKAFVEAQSPVQVQQAEITYTAVLKGGPDSTLISYKLELKPTLQKYLITSDSSGDIIDLEWRGIVVKDALVVTPQEVTANPSDLQIGEIDVNHPLGLLQALHPSVAGKLANTQASDVLNDPIANFQAFNAPMGVWHVLFDPVGAYGGGVGLTGTGGAKALSVYSLGEGSLREGSYRETERDATVTIDGAEVKAHSSTPPPSGQITIAGYANAQENQGTEFAIVTAEAPAGAQTSSGGFPIQVLLVLGGMMGAVAIFVLLKARK